MKFNIFAIFFIIHVQIFASGGFKDSSAENGDGVFISITSIFQNFDKDKNIMLGYQFGLSDIISLRFGIGFHSTNKFTQKPINTEANKEWDSVMMKINPALKIKLSRFENFELFGGLGVSYSYSWSRLSGENFKYNVNTGNFYDFTIGPILGIEWFPVKRFSITLDCMMAFSFISGKREYSAGGNTQLDQLPKTTKIDLFGSNINLLITYYFEK